MKTSAGLHRAQQLVRGAWLILLSALSGVIATAAEPETRLANLSVRGTSAQGADVLIAGFVVRGPGSRPVLIRGVGPSLARFGLTGALPVAQLRLFGRTGVLAENTGWSTSPDRAAIGATAARLGAFAFLPDSRDAALLMTLAPGAYTAHVIGANGTNGVALAEVYDAEDPDGGRLLVNLSARGRVGVGEALLISGIVVRGGAPKRLLIRAAGPALAAFGISDPLARPRLQLSNAAGALVVENAGWDQPPNDGASVAAAAQSAGAFPFLAGARDAALVVQLAAGNYTALVRGDDGGTGIALAEIYDLDAGPDTPPPASGTFYVSALRPDAGAADSPATGMLSLQLSPDRTTANVTLTLSNLSGAEISAYLRVGNTYVRGLPTGSFSGYVWTLRDVGGLSVADLLAALATGRLQLVVSTERYPAGELRGTLAAASGSTTFVPPAAAPPLEATFTDRDAARLLAQATFGPTLDEIARARSLGAAAWIDEQLGRTPTLHLPYVQQRGIPDSEQPFQARQEAWWLNSLTAPDQLRQRVAFALSELLVVSDQACALFYEARGLTNYYDLLLRDAFGNFRQLLEDVTLSPVMGTYLSHLRNRRPDPATGVRPDENYAREILQLFSIGLNQLHPDGSLKLDANGLPIATYQQATVVGLAHVFTGWSYYTPNPQPENFYTGAADLLRPMTLFSDYHDTGAKLLLDGVVLPAGGTGTQDLKSVLDQVFNHRNVGPFLARRLIQRLVTSTPSPGYIYRVSRVFDDNGAGVRGDLRAVVRAVFLDYEARSATAAAAPGFGKLREPLLRATHLMRAFNARATNGRYQYWYPLAPLGQAALSAPSVFNFFDPAYAPPGRLARAGLVAPEFQITTEIGALTVTNEIFNLVFLGIGYPWEDDTARIRLDLTREAALAADPAQLVDRLNLLLMAGAMSPAMRSIVIDAVAAIPASSPLERAQTAVYLIAVSPEGAVQP